MPVGMTTPPGDAERRTWILRSHPGSLKRRPLMSEVIAGIRIPDSKLAREATDLLREHGTPLLFAHSLRVFLFGSLRGRHRGLHVDHELLYVGAVFHDFGLTPNYVINLVRLPGGRSACRCMLPPDCHPTRP